MASAAVALGLGWASRPPIYLRDQTCPVCHQWSAFLWCRARGVWLPQPRCPRCLRVFIATVFGAAMNPSDIGRALQALRRNRKGREKVLRPCPACRQMMSARELRRHKCPEKGKRDG